MSEVGVDGEVVGGVWSLVPRRVCIPKLQIPTLKNTVEFGRLHSTPCTLSGPCRAFGHNGASSLLAAPLDLHSHTYDICPNRQGHNGDSGGVVDRGIATTQHRLSLWIVKPTARNKSAVMRRVPLLLHASELLPQ